ncbi:hypothetical protein VNI00_012779 [Paramarasmius palmivorus]|uniref:Oxidoreductase AflY n=1 Tax=Paramarasmius palmivorus TaxID=297713 RepID=A0AAW0C2V7_9AGAR
MSAISHRLLRSGVLNLPRPSPGCKPITESLLLKDAQAHHCFFRAAGLHNHLSHHILAAYDLGATSSLLQKIYDDEASDQRPIILEDQDKNMKVNTKSWKQYVGNQNAYNGFFHFFQERIEATGVSETLGEYIFSPAANEPGLNMLVRLMSGAAHPFIQIGYGLEFGNDFLVATGLAQTAVTNPLTTTIFNYKPALTQTNGTSNGTKSILELLREVYDSPKLKPVPYDSNALISARIKDALRDGGAEEVQRISSQLQVDENVTEAEVNEKIEEYIWTAVLLLFATGKEGHKPRLDFFLMHIVTSSLFLKSYVSVLQNPLHKAQLLRAYLPVIILLTLSRGRPKINAELIMKASDKVRPPLHPPEKLYQNDKTSIGNPIQDEDYNPWPALIEASLYAPDSHVLKTMRTLVYAAREYGDTQPGQVAGAYRSGRDEETHPGMAKVDGSLFVRAAGVLMDYMGWTTHGQVAGNWDRSALGWEEAWLDEE